MNEQANGFEHQPDPLMDAWDAVPRGPAIFIATLEAGQPAHGAWVNVAQPEAYFFSELDLLINDPTEPKRDRRWVVLDQIGVGKTMLPERLTLAGLHHLLAARREAGR